MKYNYSTDKTTGDKKKTFKNGKPKQDGYKPKQDGYKPKEEGYKPKQDGYKPKQDGYKPKQDGYKPKQDGYKPKQDGYKPKQDGYKPKQDGYKKEGFGESKFNEEGDRFKRERPKREAYKKESFRQREQAVQEITPIDENILYGRNAVIEALKAGRDIDKLLIQKGEKEGSILKILGEAKDKGIVIIEAEKSKLDEITGREKHQGVVAYAAAQSYVEIDDILEEAKNKGEEPFILILENIQDPHNLGAIIRSAHNAGVHGIIIPKRRAVGLSGTVAKSSAGAIEYMKVAKVTNISQTIKELKEKGIWIACADMDGKVMYQENLSGPIAIMVGNEGEGVSKLARECCDYVVTIPMYGKVNSLNASAAASVLVYEVVRQRNFIG
jgi:23S rRNA (guanosine2251-2'-O)-methyltransferase